MKNKKTLFIKLFSIGAGLFLLSGFSVTLTKVSNIGPVYASSDTKHLEKVTNTNDIKENTNCYCVYIKNTTAYVFNGGERKSDNFVEETVDSNNQITLTSDMAAIQFEKKSGYVYYVKIASGENNVGKYIYTSSDNKVELEFDDGKWTYCESNFSMISDNYICIHSEHCGTYLKCKYDTYRFAFAPPGNGSYRDIYLYKEVEKTGPAVGDTFTDNGINYEITAVGDVNTVKVGNNTSYAGDTVNIPAKVTYKGVEFNVTAIGKDAFSDCPNLTNVTLSEGLLSIESFAFQSIWLSSITIPSTVNSIDNSAFGDNRSLTTVICKGTTPPSLVSAFDMCDNLTAIKVPASSLQAYKEAAGWSTYKDIIEGFHTHSIKETHYRVEPLCETPGHEEYYECSCGKYFTDEALTQEIENIDTWLAEDGDGYLAPLGHEVFHPEYSWNEDKCTGTGKCVICGEDIKETVTAKYVKDTPATCMENEKGHYEATFTIKGFEKQVTGKNSVEKSYTALGHDFGGEVTYTWNEDKCTASWKCQRDGCEEIQSEEATLQNGKTKYITDTPATCLENEKGHYEATFTIDDFVKQSTAANSVVKPDSALGHDFGGEVTYTWNDDKCTASWKCQHDGCEEIQSEEASLENGKTKYITDTPATCLENEQGHYEATFTIDGFVKQSTAANSVVKVDTALGHHFSGTVTYTWDGDKCTATWYCDHSGCNDSQSETVTAVYVKDFDATCTANEKGHYEATFTVQEFEKQATSMFDIPNTAKGHDYGTPTYTWNKDYTKCTATATCSHGDSTITNEGTITIEDGYAVATFEDDIFKTQRVKLPEPAPEKSGLSGGAIAGISVGAVAGVALISYAVMFVVYAKSGKGLKFLFKSFDWLKKLFKMK